MAKFYDLTIRQKGTVPAKNAPRISLELTSDGSIFVSVSKKPKYDRLFDDDDADVQAQAALDYATMLAKKFNAEISLSGMTAVTQDYQ